MFNFGFGIIEVKSEVCGKVLTLQDQNTSKVATITDTNRFQDKNMVLSQFENEIFVECPKCEKRAVVTKEEPSYFSKRVLKCPNCFYSISTEWNYQSTGRPSENFFGLPLWLTENFRGNNFWAFNYKHLEYLKQYISAGLREKNGRIGWTMVEKLPTWMTSGKNRDKIINLISDLERK